MTKFSQFCHPYPIIESFLSQKQVAPSCTSLTFLTLTTLNLETRVQYDQLGTFLKLKYHVFEQRTEKYLGDTIESGNLSILYIF